MIRTNDASSVALLLCAQLDDAERCFGAAVGAEHKRTLAEVAVLQPQRGRGEASGGSSWSTIPSQLLGIGSAPSARAGSARPAEAEAKTPVFSHLRKMQRGVQVDLVAMPFQGRKTTSDQGDS